MRSSAHLVAGSWVPGQRRGGIEVHDPADGTPVGVVSVAGPDEVAAAVAGARDAARAWARIDPVARGSLLREAAGRVADAEQDLAVLTTREMGKPVQEARSGVAAGVAALLRYAETGPLHGGAGLRGACGATDLVVREPRGVVAVITPWNDPVAVPCGLLGAALVTGNTVVLKPSERTPLTGLALVGALAAGLPPGVVNLVSGDGSTGAALAAHPDVDLVAHVGSTATGRQVARAAAVTGAAVLLENGGKDPLLVDAGVDPAWAARLAAAGCFANAGQICTSVERVYVHASVATAFLDALVEESGRLRSGPGLDPATQLGPMVDRRQRDHVHAQVLDAVARGARRRCGGVVPAGPGSFYPATVLDGCTDDMTVMHEETFGPVAPVRVVSSFDEGLTAACRSRYGLAATVLTPSMAHAQQAWRELPVGTVTVNAVSGGAPGGSAEPRRDSGRGTGYGPGLLDEVTAPKVVHLSPTPD